ncbi:FkbM family methyltransferase [Candidatus Pelagibacter sp. HIMB1517]|uniref:FkbM family methyltransferase n=1 Tax=Candidatus Pelagibacter sp. HIMB1517 TaxID=3413341 RepID=UPI003F84D7CD
MRTSYKIAISKVIYFILTKIFFIREKQIVNRKGIVWNLDLSEGIDLSIFLFGDFQSDITNQILKLSKNYDGKYIILDIGSNIGDKSLTLVKKYSNLKKQIYVYSLEPTSYALSKQRKNLKLNIKLSEKISLNKIFITDKKKVNKKSTYSSWNISKKAKGKTKHNVHHGLLKKIDKKTRFCSLDYFVKLKKINEIFFIKIDVDGYELNVLKSGYKTIKKFEPFIMLEYAEYALKEQGFSFKDFQNFLKKINYEIYDLKLKKLDKLNVAEGSSKDILIANSEKLKNLLNNDT